MIGSHDWQNEILEEMRDYARDSKMPGMEAALHEVLLSYAEEASFSECEANSLGSRLIKFNPQTDRRLLDHR